MQNLEVSGAVRHIYIYIYIYVIRRLKVNFDLPQREMYGARRVLIAGLVQLRMGGTWYR